MRSILLLGLGAFALGLDAYVIAGLLPIVAADFDTSVAVAGQMVTAFTLSYGIASPVVATLVPAERQRAALFGALLVFSVGNAGTAMATSLPMLLGMRALAGASAGLYLALAVAAASTLVSKERRGQALTLVIAGMSSGTVLGVPIGVLIAQESGWRVTMWVVTGLGVVAFVGLLATLPALPANSSPTLGQRAAVLKDPRVASIVGVSFLAAVASLGLYTYMAPMMGSAAMGGVDNITPYLWVWGVGGVLGSLMVGPLVDRSGLRPFTIVVIIMATLSAALLLLPGLASVDPVLALAPILVWGAVGWALQVPQQHDLLSMRGEKGGSVAVALNESALYLGSAVGSTLGGIALAVGFGMSSLPLAAGAVALLGLLLQITGVRIFMRRGPKGSEPAPARGVSDR
ncbi:MFS transporter [Nocardiopsis sp. HNM0947]|uniref:MFS transporter n=1 Tax=Nocardiopsis coralli TaxID=2772213 RepID=A0ABR9PBE7_9ACTN|nr:MFS transporter [Nocardiopsis coralli]MBE3001165.1 MFS transporter [Nocardiopsis coralli]